ncbi:MAG: thiamine phosphate synthase [Gammaproteobacteria bacterium]
MSTATPMPRHGLYGITPGDLTGPELVRKVEASLRGGVAMLQYRAKAAANATDAHTLLALCRRHRVPLIINDDPGLAAEVGADGVHVGHDDTDPRAARARLGAGTIIGVSCYDSLDRARDAVEAGADYVAFGSVFASPTKPGAVRPGLDLIARARAELALPIVAIGGITPDNGAQALDAGADLLAVVTGLYSAADPQAAAGAYLALFER